jgi:hypothetical protein
MGQYRKSCADLPREIWTCIAMMSIGAEFEPVSLWWVLARKLNPYRYDEYWRGIWTRIAMMSIRVRNLNLYRYDESSVFAVSAFTLWIAAYSCNVRQRTLLRSYRTEFLIDAVTNQLQLIFYPSFYNVFFFLFRAHALVATNPNELPRFTP